MMENNENQELIDRIVESTLNPGAEKLHLTDEEINKMRASDWAEIFDKEIKDIENRIEELKIVKNSLERAYQLSIMITISDDAKEDFLKSWDEIKEKFGSEE